MLEPKKTSEHKRNSKDDYGIRECEFSFVLPQKNCSFLSTSIDETFHSFCRMIFSSALFSLREKLNLFFILCTCSCNPILMLSCCVVLTHYMRALSFLRETLNVLRASHHFINFFFCVTLCIESFGLFF